MSYFGGRYPERVAWPAMLVRQVARTIDATAVATAMGMSSTDCEIVLALAAEPQ